MRIVLRPLVHLYEDGSDTDSLQAGGVEVLCADEKVRKCVPILCTWHADYMENINIHGIKLNLCPMCTVPKEALGTLPKTAYSQRDHLRYQQYLRSKNTALLDKHGMKPISNALWSLPTVSPQEVMSPDILHNIHSGIMEHLMEWIDGFLKKHNRLSVFDDIWSNIPPYPGYFRPNKPYRSVTQWSGKEMRYFGRVILACFTAALRGQVDNQGMDGATHVSFSKAIKAVRYLSDFCLMAQYPSHTQETVTYMKNYLTKFHEYSDVFIEFRARKAAKKHAKKAAKELALDQATLYDYFKTATQKANLRKEHREERAALVQDIVQCNSSFNFPKLHLLSHYAEQVFRFGSLLQYSTEISEAMHKPLKDAYRRSNKVDATEQILDIYTRTHSMAMLEKNLVAWSRILLLPREYLDALEGRELDGEQSKVDQEQLIVRLMQKQHIEEIVPGKHGKRRRDLKLLDVADELHLPRLVELTYKFFQLHYMHACPADEDKLATYPAEIFTAIDIKVPDFQGQEIQRHIARCTGTRRFRNRSAPRADWVWVRYKAKEDNRVTLPWLGAGEEGIVRVENRGEDKSDRVVNVSDIEGIAHLIELEPGRCWIVNSRIDLTTWNQLYD
ncbi:hypothetical protein BDZ91DRAFT_785668 [Kalaharituber pfeilii]|nr:hypothetical protein BDZ91DRAFT_785668 [Kalaharituber pfeilii]